MTSNAAPPTDPPTRGTRSVTPLTGAAGQSTTSGRVLAQTVLPKSPVGDGLRYLGNHWAALQRYIEDGRLAIDNNRAENQLRVVAVGRKNWLFAGSFDGARRAALLYTLVQSCKLADVSPFGP